MCPALFRIAGRHRGVRESLEAHPVSPLVFQCFSSALQLRLRWVSCAEATPPQRGGYRRHRGVRSSEGPLAVSVARAGDLANP